MLNVLARVSACRHRTAAAAIAGAVMVMTASGAAAQNNVNALVIVNGDPITAFDIEQRTRFLQLANNKTPTRQEVLDELIDEKLKLQLPKRFDFPTAALDNDVEAALKNMARRQRVTLPQFTQSLASHGVQIGTLRERVKAEMIWSQIIRSKYQSGFQLSDNEILKELETRNKEDEGGYDYSLRPIIFIVPRGSPPAVIDTRKREADGLRVRFQNCDEGVPFARALRDIAVLDMVKKSSSDLPPALREILEKTEIGRLTPPEITTQGIELYALCAKKISSKDNTPGKREVREEFYSKQFRIYSKKYLKELRDQAYIVYK